MKWHLRNPENFVNDGSIICANHQSCLDFLGIFLSAVDAFNLTIICVIVIILGMITYWPTMERCAAIAKKELNYIGPFGLVAGLCGTIFIKRNKAQDSHATMNEAAEKVKEKKVYIFFFTICHLAYSNSLVLILF